MKPMLDIAIYKTITKNIKFKTDLCDAGVKTYQTNPKIIFLTSIALRTATTRLS